jgi:Cof subfamily protein (haloacid dehalogenase superfamily)
MVASNLPARGQIRLIATDLDGTLLRGDSQVSDRTRAALAHAREAGITVVIATARMPRSTEQLAHQAGIGGAAICSNGAVVWNLDSRQVERTHPLPAGAMRRAVLSLREALPGVVFGVERGLIYACEPGYAALRGPSWWSDDREDADALTLCEDPITKVTVRHPTYPLEDLTTLVADHFGDDGFVGHSGYGPAEVTARGVSKGAVLAQVCGVLGVRAEEVAAFGDMPNDAPMLAWAGWGYAMANAHPSALAATHLRAASNEEDGVAEVIERILAV